MRRVTRTAALGSMLVAVLAGVVSAEPYAPRQYYPDWK
jgi:hypothetical protein